MWVTIMVTHMCDTCPPKVVGGLFAFGDKYSPLESPLMILILFDLSCWNSFYGTGGAVIGALLCL
jgi:hypothetical protein